MENDYLCPVFPCRGGSPKWNTNLQARLSYHSSIHQKGNFYGKAFKSIEKEFLIRKFKGNSKVKLSDFCRANNVETSFRSGLKQYEEAGMGVGRADALNEHTLRGIDKTRRGISEKSYVSRIENEQLKKNIWWGRTRMGKRVCSFKKEEFKIVDILIARVSLSRISARWWEIRRSGYYRLLRRDSSVRSIFSSWWVWLRTQEHPIQWLQVGGGVHKNQFTVEYQRQFLL